MKKKILIISISMVTCICLGITFAMHKSNFISEKYANQELYNGLPVNTSHAMFMYDASTPEKAIGISDYVFIAKINKVLRTEHKNPITVEVGLNKKKEVSTPYTIYSIDVMKNIKGELTTSESIEFMQYGGLNEDGKSYTFLDEGRLLEKDKYYIIMADTFGGNGGTIEVADSNRIVELEDYNPNLKESSVLINRYEEAYKNQIVPFDNNGNARTGFMSKYDINYEE